VGSPGLLQQNRPETDIRLCVKADIRRNLNRQSQRGLAVARWAPGRCVFTNGRRSPHCLGQRSRVAHMSTVAVASGMMILEKK
jgi:hypothetical protein